MVKLFDSNELIEVENFIESLKVKPFVGRPLLYDFLSEKKIKRKRIYYLVYREICIVLLFSSSNKKLQKKEIMRDKGIT